MDSKSPSLPTKASLLSYPVCEVSISSLLLGYGSTRTSSIIEIMQ